MTYSNMQMPSGGPGGALWFDRVNEPEQTGSPVAPSGSAAPSDGGGEATFFDPYLAELQRKLQHQLTTGTADLQLKGQRLTEDFNLMSPYLERRFGQEMKTKAGGVANRGFHGQGSGVMRDQLGKLSEDQAFTRGQFERGYAREMEDVERAIASLTSSTTIAGAEGVRAGAGRASDRATQLLPF